MGVVHRDVKPGNLMLDGTGRLWVTDFGLAQFSTDARLTLSGDLLGTLRYMSPEQALAQRKVVDHRTDVYSLGVTLYELLTLRPAFGGDDRQELLRQIAFDEPAAPRRLDRSVPAELETVLLKAIAKSPAERYATAQELADDLERFLEDRPIQARRPGLGVRVRKWGQRHKVLVRAALALLVVTATVLGVATALIWQEQQRTLAERDRASINLRVALHALSDVYVRFVMQRLPREAELDEEDQKLLEKVLALFEEVAQEDHADARLRLEKGRAYCRIGTIRAKLGQVEQAGAAYEQSVAILEELVAEFPVAREYRAALADSYNALGNFAGDRGRFRDSVRAHLRASRLVEELGADRLDLPAVRYRLAIAWSNLGNQLEGAGQIQDAEDAYRKALACQEQLVADFPTEVRYGSQLAGVLSNLAGLLRNQGQLPAARKLVERAISLQQAAVTARPRGEKYRLFLRNHYRVLLDILLKQGEKAKALRLLQQSTSMQEQLVTDYPGVPGHRSNLAQSYVTLGKLLHEAERLEETVQVYQRAVDLRSQLLSDSPDDAALRRALAPTHYNLANFLIEAGRYESVARHLRRALDLEPRNAVFANALAWFLINCPEKHRRDPARGLPLAQQAVKAEPRNGEYWRTLGAIQAEMSDWKAAIASVEKGMHLLSGGEGYDWLILAEAHWGLGNKEDARKWYHHAVAWIDKNAADDEELRGYCSEVARLLGLAIVPKRDGKGTPPRK